MYSLKHSQIYLGTHPLHLAFSSWHWFNPTIVTVLIFKQTFSLTHTPSLSLDHTRTHLVTPHKLTLALSPSPTQWSSPYKGTHSSILHNVTLTLWHILLHSFAPILSRLSSLAFSHTMPPSRSCNLLLQPPSFLMGQPRPLFHIFLVFSNNTIQFLQQINAKNCLVHPGYGTRIRTHNL